MNNIKFNEKIKSLICSNIKKYRKKSNISVLELSEIIGVTPEHLKRIEAKNDRNNISLMTLYKISVVLNVRIDNFFK